MHYETFSKKHDIKREVHRQENWKKTHGVGDNKKNRTTSLISSATSLISSVAQC